MTDPNRHTTLRERARKIFNASLGWLMVAAVLAAVWMLMP